MNKIPSYQRLRQLKMEQPVYGIGLLSGTSVDAVDAALVHINTGDNIPLHVIDFIEYPFSDDLRQRILDSMQPETSRMDEICQLNFELGELFAEAASHLIKSSSIARDKISFIGSHGQTIYHIPKVDESREWHTPSTMQIGHPAIIAERTGVTTVADFRVRDMAAGGTGAPLIPFFDAFMFANDAEDILCQNIGGIANCTLIQKNGTVTAFDSGPGNMVMDALMQRLYEGKRYDHNGETARNGKVNDKILQTCLRHPFFAQHPPKATGHEDFGSAYMDAFLQNMDGEPEDTLATACELTAQSIVNAYRDFIFPTAIPKQVIISGGGTKNAYLMERLQVLCPQLRWNVIDEFGIPSAAKEAAGFALLAYATLNNIPSNIPSVSGAWCEVVLGVVVNSL